MLTHAPSRRSAQWCLLGLATIYIGAYIVSGLVGARLLLLKTALLPAFVLYVNASGASQRVVRQWLPLLSGIVLFDSLRGGVFRLVEIGMRPVFVQYPIDLERALFGTPALSLPLQAWTRSAVADQVALFFHGMHFVYFLLFGLLVWQFANSAFDTYRRAMAVVMVFGLAGYVVIPTAPPWLAADLGYLPAIQHVVYGAYKTGLPELVRAFDTNPVAAMPSLHVAFPVACAGVALRAFRRPIVLLAAVYSVGVAWAVMYLGEHYGVDVIGGVVLGVVAR